LTMVAIEAGRLPGDGSVPLGRRLANGLQLAAGPALVDGITAGSWTPAGRGGPTGGAAAGARPDEQPARTSRTARPPTRRRRFIGTPQSGAADRPGGRPAARG